MSSITASKAGLPPVLGTEVSIISRRELEPLLAKARQVLGVYDESVNCFSVVLDRTGNFLNTPEYKGQRRFCSFCKKYWHCLSPDFGGLRLWKENEYPCTKIHAEPMEESRRAGKTHVYTCVVGFIYWTSPLYRNGRYAGALLAGRVLSCSRKEAVERFRAVCGDSIAAEKFARMVEDVPVKTHEEIRALARLLGICAEEISGKGKDTGNIICRKTWQDKDYDEEEEQPAAGQKKGQSADGRGPDNAKHSVDSAYPIEKERMLFAAFRRGDSQTGSRILAELMESIQAVAPGNIDIIRYRAIELVVLLSRAAAAKTDGNNAIMETNNRYMRRIQESESAEELVENLQLAAERLGGNIFSYHGIRHAAVLRRAGRYIWENYTRKVSLEEIAKNSGLSAPYFSTTFKEEMGENLSCYLNRLRVEKAAALLSETGKPLNEIASLCGFEDQSWFSKIFKRFAGTSPGKYRELGLTLPLRAGKQHAKKETPSFPEPAGRSREGHETDPYRAVENL